MEGNSLKTRLRTDNLPVPCRHSKKKPQIKKNNSNITITFKKERKKKKQTEKKKKKKQDQKIEAKVN